MEAGIFVDVSTPYRQRQNQPNIMTGESNNSFTIIRTIEYNTATSTIDLIVVLIVDTCLPESRSHLTICIYYLLMRNV